jgi:histidinol dehydrogenase
MKIIENPLEASLPRLLQRPAMDHAALFIVVQGVLDAVKKEGDKAVAAYTQKFDGVTIDDATVSETEINEAAIELSPALKEAIQLAAKNIRCFHEAQVAESVKIETMPGVSCWRKSVGIKWGFIYRADRHHYLVRF